MGLLDLFVSVISSSTTRHSCPAGEGVAVMCTSSDWLAVLEERHLANLLTWLAKTLSRKALKAGRSASARTPQTPTHQPGARQPEQARAGQVRLADRPVAVEGQVADRGEIVEIGVALQPGLRPRPATAAAPRSASPARSGGPAARGRSRCVSAPCPRRARLFALSCSAAALPRGGAVRRRPPHGVFVFFIDGPFIFAQLFRRQTESGRSLRLQRLGRGDVRRR